MNMAFPRTAAGPRGGLAALGDWLRDHRRAIQRLQWGMVAVYVLLLVWPVLVPLPGGSAHLYDNVVLFAQFVFWGLWWPGVIASMLLVGRVWCGVFCPEGTLTEWASRHGRGGRIPRWIRWPGWPFTAFALTTVYGQLVSVYEYPKATLIVLGGSTVAAVAVGLLYGRGKRVWCRYLCPVNGVFGLLSRLAPLHFAVDRKAWNAAPRGTRAVDCAPLIEIRTMRGNGACHLCGRCSGHRNAVTLAGRSPNQEIRALRGRDASPWEAVLLMFGLLGIATGAFQWSSSPWFVALKQQLATWLVERDWMLPLRTDIPWWLLTHYPATHDVFSWLDGAVILLYIGAYALVLGGILLATLIVAGRVLGETPIPWRLAYGWTPLGGISVFVGLSGLTAALLRAEGWTLDWVGPLHLTLLGLALVWSGFLTRALLAPSAGAPGRRGLAWVCLMAGAVAASAPWLWRYLVW